MKNNKIYLILTIIFLLVFSAGQIIPLLPESTDNSYFLLTNQEENIQLYDSTSYISIQNLTQTIIETGILYAYETVSYELNVSPFTSFTYNPGDYINSGDLLYTGTTINYNGKIQSVICDDVTSVCYIDILNLDKLLVSFQVNQENADIIDINKEIIVRYNDKEYSGVISEIGNEFVNGYLTVIGTFTYNNDDLQLRQGAVVSVSILIREKENVLVVPKLAVYYLDGIAYVDKLVNVEGKETLIPTSIILGIEGDYYFEIISGISINTEIAY